MQLPAQAGSHQKQRLVSCIHKLHLYRLAICMVIRHELVIAASSKGETQPKEASESLLFLNTFRSNTKTLFFLIVPSASESVPRK